MYNNMTFNFLLGRMLGRVPDGFDKREGSVIYDALSPTALELARFYSELDCVIDETFADTAGREMLIRRAAERDIEPYTATYAEVRGVFNIAVPVGARFSLGELRYRVTETVGSSAGGGYRLVCESIGTVGNRSVGDLLPVDYIEGLTSARIVELLIPARDDEGLEQLRQRYFESLQVQSYGGNAADYRRMALSVQGVGGVKVEPAWNGGGTVRLIVQDGEFLPASSELLMRVSDVIDPLGESGKGVGLAPIGHRVTVVSVRGVEISVSAAFTLAEGWTFAGIKADLENIVAEYLQGLSAAWSQTDALIVRAAQIEARLLSEPHGRVIDIADLKLNGGVSGRNITLLPNDVPLRGAVLQD
ncbi:MAG: baseplate J/gp47 family protein [Oscillospiraceae bacterium]|nr:baseplate J/gp47 family protein [Oscillospiraceae bacterium]